jgi:Protein of unknown function (DUF2927)
MRTLVLLAAFGLATACAPAPDAQVTKARAAAPAGTETAVPELAFVANPSFGYAPPAGSRGNAAITQDFMDLTFAMESGRQLPTFSRFEGTITVAMTGDVPGSATGDLAALMARFRAEAGIDLRAATPGEAASITIDFSPRAQLRKLAPTAACFVVPNASDVGDYKAKRGTIAVDWANVAQRRQVAIFVPSDASAQEVRDCLHEEMAQAMGPLNDLYRLPDSVFNDDNFHSVLTPFDMLILRAYYAPELRSGMSKQQVASVIGGLISRLNPAGAGNGGGDTSTTPKSWSTAIETALGGGAGQGTRRAAADRALMIARAQGWTDGRLAFSHFAIARLYVGSDRARAVQEFTTAAEIYRRLPGGSVHVAHIEMQLAAIAVASGQPEKAIAFADRAAPVVKQAQNYALLATVQLIKAEALDNLGRSAEAEALRVDSQQWARYGFGSDAQMRARKREIAALGSSGSRG